MLRHAMLCHCAMSSNILCCMPSPCTCYYYLRKGCQGKRGKGWGHHWCCGGAGWGPAAPSCLHWLGAQPFQACPHPHCLSSCSSSTGPPHFSTCTLPLRSACAEDVFATQAEESQQHIVASDAAKGGGGGGRGALRKKPFQGVEQQQILVGGGVKVKIVMPQH